MTAKTKKSIDGPAIVYCDGAFNTPNGKTAHGLVRFTERYDVLGVIDSKHAGKDAGEVLDRKPNGIPIFKSFEEGMKELKNAPKTFVVGLAPDGGRLPDAARKVVAKALEAGLNVDSGLHDLLTNDPKLVKIATDKKLRIRDIRKTPDRDQLHFFTGKIEEVKCLKVAVLGTDSAVGKRTTAWLIVHGLRAAGYKAEMVGTGQTAFLQGAKYSMMMDSCINDFVAGEIEHAVHSAWVNEKPDVIVIEGQGSLMNPAYPGGFEILAAGRPDCVVLQHAPRRKEYDGFPGHPLHPLQQQVEAIEILSGKPVVAITINHEDMTVDEIEPEYEQVAWETGLPAFDVLEFGAEGLVNLLIEKLK